MKLKNFKIELRENPIGIDCKHPRFSWILASKEQNVMQTAYQLIVKEKDVIVWNTEKVDSEQSTFVTYKGKTLQSMTTYMAFLKVWDNKGNVSEYDGYFETGLLGEDKFNAQWITHKFKEEDTTLPIFVKEFSTEKAVRKVRIYVTSLGIYELNLNGERVGDAYFTPGWTSYHNRLQYQTYDITETVKQENKVEITVANGWYKGFLGFFNQANHYGNKVALLAMIRIEYADGSIQTIGTDTDWQVTSGNCTYSELYYGERQDWNSSAFTKKSAILLEDTSKIGKLSAQENESVRITKRFKPIEKIITPKGELVLNFGQNIAGFVEVELPKLRGEKLIIRHAETLDKEGNFYPETLRYAISIDEFTYGDNEVGTLVHPRFTFHGFQYIAIEGVDNDVDINKFTACALHTDMEQTGKFICNNPFIQKLQSNIEWSQRDNFLDIPTDCPQRDERLGWTGDAQVFFNTAQFNFNTTLFFEKWLRDLKAEQTIALGVPGVIPNILGDQPASAAWGDCATIIPWNLYVSTGDISIIENQYSSMCDWITYIESKCGENGLWQKGFQYGDWLGLDAEKNTIGDNRSGATDRYLVANAYYIYSTRIVRDVAKILDKIEDYEKYAKKHQDLIEAMNEEYVTKTGRLVSETQTACVLMLYFDIIKEEYKEKVLQTLELNLAEHKNHIVTGFTGTPYILHCLSENGKHQVAEAVFLKEDCPGWLYAVKKGATTIWERWDSILPNGDFDESGMNSLNHYANGSIGEWFYKKIAGINPLTPGYKHILIKPTLTIGMTEVSAQYKSVYGLIESSWSCKDGQITVDIQIPANTTAVVVLPEKEEAIEVGSGSYHFEYETETKLELERFSFESTLGAILTEPVAVDLFNQMAPGMLDNPMLQYAHGMTLAELIAAAPEGEILYKTVVDALNRLE